MSKSGCGDCDQDQPSHLGANSPPEGLRQRRPGQRSSAQVPIGVEERIWITSFRGAVCQVMQQRVDPSLRDVGVLAPIERGVEERGCGSRPSEATVRQVMQQRVDPSLR